MSVNLWKPPTLSDGRQIITTTAFGNELDVYFCSRGDDVTNGLKLRGEHFVCTKTDSGDASFEWQYITSVHINGGMVTYRNASVVDKDNCDYVRYQIYAPATVGTSNPGSGGYNKVDMGGGAHMYTRNATNEGDWDLNLTEKLNANVDFTKVTPIPANGAGDFDYNPDTEAVTLNSSGTGNSYLFDFNYVLTEIVNDEKMDGDGVVPFTVPATYIAKKLHPHWKHKVLIHRHTTGTLKVFWDVFGARVGARP